MDYTQTYSDLKAKFPQITIEKDHPLAPYTTLKIGGPADIFIHTKQPDEFVQLLQYLSKLLSEVNNFSDHSEREQAYDEPEGSEDRKNSFTSNLAITILGNGSNVLISDSGIRGIVIKNTASDINILDTTPIPVDFHHTYTQRMENEPDKYLDFTKLDYDESMEPQVLVELASGTPLPLTINRLLDQGITGLQWFAYIPGTIGGATAYNLHGGNYHFSDYIDSVTVFNLHTGQTQVFAKSDLDWKYEKTYFQQHPELIILSTTLRLFRGDAAKAKKVKDAWIAQKVKVQPMNSAGSTFANPSLEDCQKIWGEQKSSGWIIDHELNLKGHRIGQAQISLQHSNFIVNLGLATSSDVYQLIKLVQSQTESRFGLKLEPEIKLLGEF